MLKRKQALQHEQKEMLSATISAGTLSLLNIALILGLLMQDYNINSPNINGRAIAFFAVELSRNKTTTTHFLENVALPHGNIQLFCINGSCEISMLVRYQQFQHQESSCVFSCRGVGVESRAALRCQTLKRRCRFCARTTQGRPRPLPPAKACCTARELISGLSRHAPWRVSAAPRSAARQLRPRHQSAALVAAA